MTKEIDFKKDFRKSKDKKTKVSIIIVAYNTSKELIDCLNSLKKQTDKDFEIILIDNGKEDLEIIEKYDLLYIKLKRNYGPSLARNIGVKFSRSKIIAFLDDDAVTNKNWVKEIILTFKNLKIKCFRGKILPKNKNNIFNYLAGHYNLGSRITLSLLGIEGNCAFKKDFYEKIKGFNPKLFGSEGLELSYRILKTGNKITYQPKVIIYHDFADSLKHFIKKNFRHGRKNRMLNNQNNKLLNLEKDYVTYIKIKPKGYFLNMKLILIKLLGLISYKFGYHFLYRLSSFENFRTSVIVNFVFVII